MRYEKMKEAFPKLWSTKPELVSVPPGWRRLVMKASASIESRLPGPVSICSISSDRGALRIFLDEYPDGVTRIIHAIERRSMKICEVCGRAADLRYDLKEAKTLCDDHAVQYELD